MGNNASNYHKLSGYCLGQDGLQTATMVKDSENDHGVLVGITPSSGATTVSTVKTSIGHANDITYYNGVYYVIKGGREGHNSNIIKRYNKQFSHIDGDYSFNQNVTCIAHISGKYFFLGNAEKLFICELNESNECFDNIKTLTLPESGTVVDGWTRQGMCYYNSRLYKAYGKAEDGRIRKNYVAKYTLKGDMPKYDSIVFSAAYSCNKTEKYLFEVEGVAVSSIGSYVAADVRNDKDDHSASIYKIGFYSD